MLPVIPPLSLPLSRRRLLKATTVTAITAAVTTAATLAPLPHPASAQTSTVFAHGVASGDPLPDAVILWTRVTTAAPAATVTWQLAVDEEFTQPVTGGTAVATAAVDHTVHVDATGLAPDTAYFYRFTCDGETSPTGRTRTAPAAGAHVERLRWAVASCANWESGHFAAYRDLAERGRRGELDMVVFLGDYLYEYARGEYVGPSGPVRDHEPAGELATLADYRTRYRTYRTDPHLQAAHAALPWVVVWDDHEFADNAWSGGAVNHTEPEEGAWAPRRDAAMQAYFEWLPIRAAAPSAGGHLYRQLGFGDLASLTMMDLRTYRDKAVDHTQWLAGGQSAALLGSEQFAWLTERISAARARWNVLGNSVMFSPMALGRLTAGGDDQGPQLSSVAEFLGGRVSDGIPLNLDQWDGFAADRARLAETLAQHAAAHGSAALFLTGDIHSEWGNAVYSRDREIGAELVCSSISAPNVNEQLRLPEDNGISQLAEAALRAGNPHVSHVDLDAHGYAIAAIDHEGVDMAWLRVSELADPASSVTEAVRRRWRIAGGFRG